MTEWKVTLIGTRWPRVDGPYVVLVEQAPDVLTQEQAIEKAKRDHGGTLLAAKEMPDVCR